MKQTTAEADPAAMTKLRELIENIEIAMMTTVTPDGTLRSRPMVTEHVSEHGELWFFTSDDSGKMEDIEAEHGVNLSYADPRARTFVSITGNASIVRDREKTKAFWDPQLRTFFPRGLDDPHLALLCVRVESAEYWDEPSSRMMKLYHTAKAAMTGHDGDEDHVRVDIRAARASG